MRPSGWEHREGDPRGDKPLSMVMTWVPCAPAGGGGASVLDTHGGESLRRQDTASPGWEAGPWVSLFPQ